MANEADEAAEIIEAAERLGVNAARRAVADMDDGSPGTCRLCWDDWERLVNGACARCRDAYGLP